jgi:hypothetical protein
MRCNRVRRLIPLGAGRDLEPPVQAGVEQHLRTCLSCYREFRAYRSALADFATLASGGDATAPQDLADSIMAAVRAGRPGPAAPTHTWGDRLRYVVPLAATFVAFAVAGFYLFGGGAPGDAGTPPRAFKTIDVPTHGMVVGYTDDGPRYDALPQTIELPRAWFGTGARPPAFDATQPIPVTTVPPVRMTGYAPRRGF